MFKQIEKTDEPDRSIGFPVAESTVVYDDRPPVLQRSVSYSEKKKKKKKKKKRLFKIMLYYDEGIVLISALECKITVYFCYETDTGKPCFTSFSLYGFFLASKYNACINSKANSLRNIHHELYTYVFVLNNFFYYTDST